MNIKWIEGEDSAILLESEVIEGRVAPAGMIWNGASIPNWLHSVLFISPFHHTVRRASIIHDWMYISQQNRKDADRLYLKLCKDDGANILQCYAMYYALRLFGGWAYRRCRK